MSTKKRRSDQAGRAKMRSPGRPPVLHRSERRPFWQAIADGCSSEQAASISEREQVAPDSPGSICPVAIQETLAHVGTQDFVGLASLAWRAPQPRVEPATRDTERPAHHSHRPGSSVLSHEAELHIDSRAK